jgi:hypothetical protein
MADVWYSLGTFWGAAGAVAVTVFGVTVFGVTVFGVTVFGVTVFGVTGIVAAYKQANPIQRLGYKMPQSPQQPGISCCPQRRCRELLAQGGAEPYLPAAVD